MHTEKYTYKLKTNFYHFLINVFFYFDTSVGEVLEAGIQEAYILADDEALVLSALDFYEDKVSGIKITMSLNIMTNNSEKHMNVYLYIIIML